MPNARNTLASRLRFLKGTPLHPQWFAHREEASLFRKINGIARGIVLDVGCSDQRVRGSLAPDVRYFGLDYPETASEWYGTLPSIFGDAHLLPLADESTDTVLLLDVLEHLASPGQSVREIHRVLKPGGAFVMRVPFLYPIHDAPRDFHRWTQFGLEQLMTEAGFSVKEILSVGHPLQTAALMTNIAWSKTVLNWIGGRNPLAVAALGLPIAIPLVNLSAHLFSWLSRSEPMMPHSYICVLEKRALTPG